MIMLIIEMRKIRLSTKLPISIFFEVNIVSFFLSFSCKSPSWIWTICSSCGDSNNVFMNLVLLEFDLFTSIFDFCVLFLSFHSVCLQQSPMMEDALLWFLWEISFTKLKLVYLGHFGIHTNLFNAMKILLHTISVSYNVLFVTGFVYLHVCV